MIALECPSRNRLTDYLQRRDGANQHAHEIAVCATQLLDCMRRSEDGVLLLPIEEGWGDDSDAALAHALSLQAMDLLVCRGLARPSRPDPLFPKWPAFELAMIVGVGS